MFLFSFLMVFFTIGCDSSRREEVRERWPGGQKRLVAVYHQNSNSAEIDIMKEFNELGNLIRQTRFLNGGEVKISEISSGKTLETRVYRDSILIEVNGEIARRIILDTWDDGYPKVEVIYTGTGSKEEIFERTTLSKNGRILNHERLDLGEKTEYLYSAAGELKGKRLYRDGKLTTVNGYQASEVTESTWPDGSKRKVAIYIRKDDQEILFEAVELAKDGQPLRFEVPGEEYERQFTYHGNGNLKSEVEFRAGVKSGFEKLFDDRNLLLTSRKYINGKLHGNCFEFNPDGGVRINESWEDSLLIAGSYFNPDGSLSSIITEGAGKKTIFYDDGSRQSTAEYVNGVRSGSFTIWNRGGTKISSMHFSDGCLNGKSRTWDDKGVRKSTAEYKNGKKHGRFIFYGNNGVRKFAVNYDDGAKHGLYRTYNSGGAIVYEAVFEHGNKVAEKWISR